MYSVTSSSWSSGRAAQSYCSQIPEGRGCRVFGSTTKVWVSISGVMSKAGTMTSRHMASHSSCWALLKRGKPSSMRPRAAGQGTTENLPLTPLARHHSANSRVKEVGWTTGRSSQRRWRSSAMARAVVRSRRKK